MTKVTPNIEFEQVVDDILAANGSDEVQRTLPSNLNANWLLHLESPLTARVARFGNVVVRRGYFGEKDNPSIGRSVSLDERTTVYAAEGARVMYRSLVHEIGGLSYRMTRDLMGSLRTIKTLDRDEKLATTAWLKAPFLTPDPRGIIGKLSDKEVEALAESTEEAKRLDSEYSAITERGQRRGGYLGRGRNRVISPRRGMQ